MHPRSKHWHQIYFIITRKADLRDFLITRALRGAECWTDHRSIRSIVSFQIRPPIRKQAKKKKQIDRALFHNQDKLTELQTAFHSIISQLPEPITFNPTPEQIESDWKTFSDSIYFTLTDTLGFSTRNHQDWFDQSRADILDLLRRKNNAHLAALNNPTSNLLKQKFKALRQEAQRALRRIQNQWWSNKAVEIQQYAELNDQQNFYNAIKTTYGPTQSTTAPLMSADGATLIKDKNGILDRWVEYLSSLLNQNNPIDPTFADRLPNLPLLNNLDLTPSFTETLKACNSLKNNKAPGPDGIPGELFKFGGHIVMKRLHLMIQIFWEAGYIPQSLKDPLIVMIYKRKGQKSECGNYRGISLLDVAGKVFARILLFRLLDSVASEKTEVPLT
ncbi:uncharacterized protein LOC143028030 [Oratosquilla oratoria]|uniref:uncharacterized protein LOC143028030 n=1 Tax=Oratosquilla oratoria TaxID=337810 RepID=UPI003F75F757